MLNLLLPSALALLAAPGADVDAVLASDGAGNYVQVTDYDLQVRLEPAEKKLTASGSIRFTNRTSLPIDALWWHLYLNAFRNDRSTFMRESHGGRLRGASFERGQWGWIEVRRLATLPAAGEGAAEDLLAGRTFEHPDDDNAEDRTVMRTPFARPVPPGGTIAVQVAFEAVLPKVFARSGWGGTFFMVGQWFPKLGVPEVTADGGRPVLRWNCHQYHANSEFFADYGHYRVAITVPTGYEVGATGARIAEAAAPDGQVTLTYEQDRVHDFAFAVDPRFLRRERTFDPDVEVSAAETREASDLLALPASAVRLGPVKVTLLVQPEHDADVDRYFRAALAGIKWFGLWYGAYPYPTLTIIDPPRTAEGAMGMEYPTLITGGTSWPSPPELPVPEAVTVHEFGHQYWYGLVGTNEFEESWLDEGFNTYSTGKVLDRAYGDFTYAPSLLGVPLMPWFSGVRLDQLATHRIGSHLRSTVDAVVRRAWEYRDAASYRVNSYPRSGLVLRGLEQELGHSRMARAMRLHHLLGRYRHPKTADFIRAVESVAGRPMGEFFERTVRTAGDVDYAVTELDSDRARTPAGVFDDGREVTIEAAARGREAERYETTVYVERLGEVAWPVELEVRFEDGTRQSEHWDGGDRWMRYRHQGTARATAAEVHAVNGGRLVLDVDETNDGRAPSGSAFAGFTWGAIALYATETLLQLLGGVL